MKKTVYIVVAYSKAGRPVAGGMARFEREQEAREHLQQLERAGLIGYYKEVVA